MMESVTDFVHRVGGVPGNNARVRVWFADLDKQPAEMAQLSWLSTSEHVKAVRLKMPHDRRRYLASCVVTRQVLSNETGILPENLQILTDKCGKPRLSPLAVVGRPPSKSLLRFNVSHSENFLCIATALGSDVGVDIEVENPGLDILAISHTCLDQEDNERVQCSSLNERSLLFYQLWTRREAFAKMLGHGVNSDHVHRTPAPPWSLRSLELTLEEKQIVGSLAIATRQPLRRAISRLCYEGKVPMDQVQ